MNATSVFITGTDTDAGKTVVGTAVLNILRGRGIDAVPMKPIQTGCAESDSKTVGPDLRFYLEMGDIGPVAERERQKMELYKFNPACSPHLAAHEAGCEIEFPPIVDALQWLHNRHDCVVIEGAGGVLAPIAGRLTMLDLMRVLGLPVILVARPGLGTLNHTLLSLRELRRVGLQVLGVVICSTQPVPWGMIENNNRRTIEDIGETTILGCLPFIPGIGNGRCTPAEFRRIAVKNINLDLLSQCIPTEQGFQPQMKKDEA